MELNMFYSIKIAIIIALIYPLNLIFAGENSWSTNGPSGATVYTIEINPVDRANIYIGTISNGIYETSDGGEHWRHVDNNNMFTCMRGIAINPRAPETIFAGTTRGLYKSTDSGASWSFVWLPQFPHNEVDVVQYHQSQPNLIFAGTRVNAWKSYDDGNTWEALDIPQLTGMIDMKVAPHNPDLIYMLGTSLYTGQGVWKSEDRGNTWINVHNNIDSAGSGTDIDIDPVDNDIVYFSVDNLFNGGPSYIYKTTDGGNSWANIAPDFLISPYATAIKISPVDRRIIYAGTLDNGVIISENSGDTWTEMNTGLTTRHAQALVIDTLTLNMYLGTIYDGIYKKRLGAEAWQKISLNINNASCSQLSVSEINGNKAYVVAANGLFYTEDLGESWSYVDIGIPSGNAVWGLAFDRYLPNLLYASSGTDTFTDTLLAPNGFYKSQDSGNTWEFLNDGLPDSLSYATIEISYSPDGTKRIFLGADHGLFYSDNSGGSWEICDGNLPTNISYGLVEVSPSDLNTVAAVNYLYNRLFISHNRGDSWEEPGELPSYNNGGIIDFQFSPDNSSRMYIGSYHSGLYESFDGGQSWVNINNDLPVDPGITAATGITINPFNPANIFVVSTHRGIFQSHNGGINWESFNTGFDTTGGSALMKFAGGDTTAVYLASSTRSVWSIHRTPTGIDDDHQPLPSQFSLSAYPNPFNATTNISFSLPTASNVSLDIYDLLGRRAVNLLDSYLPEGNHSLLWHPEDIAAGVYIYCLTTDNSQTSHKITLLK